MAGEGQTLPVDPVTGLISVIQFSKNWHSNDVIDGLKNSGIWYDPKALEVTRDRIADRPPSRPKVQRNIDRVVKTIENRIEELGGPEFGDDEPPRDDDYADPGIIYDQPDSPIFGAPAVAGAILSPASKKFAAQRALERSREIERIISGAKDYEMTTIDKAKRIIAIAKKNVPDTKKLFKLGAKYLKKVKPSSIGRLGGLSGIAVSVGGQLGIEKASEILARRQFAEMERILKKQQRETDAVLQKSKSTKAPIKSKAPIKAPPKTPVARSNPVAPAPTIAKQPVPATAAKIDPPRPAASVKTSAPTKLPKATISTPGQKVVQFAKQVNQFAPLLTLLRNQPKANTSRSSFVDVGLQPSLQPQTRTQTSSGRLGFSASEKTCACPKPRMKSTKKRKRKVCVTPSAARAAGLIT